MLSLAGMDASMGKVEIIPATDAERDWAAHLMVGMSPWTVLGVGLDQCKKSCWDNMHRMYVAHLGQDPCGFIILHDRGVAGSPYIKSIAVDGQFQGQGIGLALMDFAEGLYNKTARHLFLCVSSFNTGARKFYEQRGFRKVGEFEDYIAPGYSETLMMKRLS